MLCRLQNNVFLIGSALKVYLNEICEEKRSILTLKQNYAQANLVLLVSQHSYCRCFVVAALNKWTDRIRLSLKICRSLCRIVRIGRLCVRSSALNAKVSLWKGVFYTVDILRCGKKYEILWVFSLEIACISIWTVYLVELYHASSICEKRTKFWSKRFTFFFPNQICFAG